MPRSLRALFIQIDNAVKKEIPNQPEWVPTFESLEQYYNPETGYFNVPALKND